MQPFTFFISYRRRDTAPIALLLKNEIERRLRFVRVYVDVESIRPGEDFPRRIREMIDHSHATIALIGEQWMPLGNTDSSEDHENDWVVRELEYSRSAPLRLNAEDSYGRAERFILPLFANCERTFARFSLPEKIRYLASLNAESIDYANWPGSIGPLLDRIAVTLNLKARPDQDEYPPSDPAKARTQPLDDRELATILKFDDYDGWYVDNFGNSDVRYLTKIFEFPHFNQAADFMALVAGHCRIISHHPEWRNVFNHVTVALTTWDAHRRVTIYDLNLALFMNMAARTVVQQ